MTKRNKLNAKHSPSRSTTAKRKRVSSNLAEVAAILAEIGRSFYARGWVLGTSGNFSAVISREPLQLAITSTGLDKGDIHEKGTENLWLQPLDGSPGRQITNFHSDNIAIFQFSPDGKTLGVMRSHIESDVVLLQDTNTSER